MILDRVTMTGADDSIEPHQLVQLSRDFPFVEWGILASDMQQGTKRFPSLHWINELTKLCEKEAVQLSLHLCGRYVRALMKGDRPAFLTWAWLSAFQRIQLNFHGEPHTLSLKSAACIMRELKRPIILQADGTKNDESIVLIHQQLLSQVQPLYDVSGGIGIVPKEWPAANPIFMYQGYAGGLGPDTIEHELHRIGRSAGKRRFWIDMETRVRSNSDQLFDLTKVREVLEYCAPFITAPVAR